MTYVYFIQKGYGSIKIGVSNNPERRLKTLQTGNHGRLHIILQVPFKSRKEAMSVERALHSKFDYLKINGEWFKRAILRKLAKRSKLFPHIFDGGIMKGYAPWDDRKENYKPVK